MLILLQVFEEGIAHDGEFELIPCQLQKREIYFHKSAEEFIKLLLVPCYELVHDVEATGEGEVEEELAFVVNGVGLNEALNKLELGLFGAKSGLKVVDGFGVDPLQTLIEVMRILVLGVEPLRDLRIEGL